MNSRYGSQEALKHRPDFPKVGVQEKVDMRNKKKGSVYT